MKRLIEIIGLAPSEHEQFQQRLQVERTRITTMLSRHVSAQRTVSRTVAPKATKKSQIAELQIQMERLGIKSLEELQQVLGG